MQEYPIKREPLSRRVPESRGEITPAKPPQKMDNDGAVSNQEIHGHFSPSSDLSHLEGLFHPSDETEANESTPSAKAAAIPAPWKEEKFLAKVIDAFAWKNIKGALNPVQIAKDIKKNFGTLRASMRLSDDEIQKNPELAKGHLLKRAFGSLAAAEIAGWTLSPVLAAIGQYTTGNLAVGFAAGILGSYLGPFIAYDLSWYNMNKEFYHSRGDTPLKRLGALLKDVVPLHALATAFSIPFTAAVTSISYGTINGLSHAIPQMGENFPIPVANLVIGAFIWAPYYLFATGRQNWFTDTILPSFQNYLSNREKKGNKGVIRTDL